VCPVVCSHVNERRIAMGDAARPHLLLSVTERSDFGGVTLLFPDIAHNLTWQSA
jgi:hypothetical protein